MSQPCVVTPDRALTTEQSSISTQEKLSILIVLGSALGAEMLVGM